MQFDVIVGPERIHCREDFWQMFLKPGPIGG